MAAPAARQAGVRLRTPCLTIALVLLACRDRPDASPDTDAELIDPVGTGTERLLTHERLALLDQWIRASVARTGRLPRSLDDVRPPDDVAEGYVPLDQFLRDGWGRAIEYQPGPSRAYELRSLGADGQARTEDDLTLRAAPGSRPSSTA